MSHYFSIKNVKVDLRLSTQAGLCLCTEKKKGEKQWRLTIGKRCKEAADDRIIEREGDTGHTKTE